MSKSKGEERTVSLRYLLGKDSFFNRDAKVAFKECDITVNGEAVEGAKVKSVTVDEDGRGLLVTLTVPAEYDLPSLSLDID